MNNAYKKLFLEMQNKDYCTFNVYDYFFGNSGVKYKKNIIIRVDVDFRLDLALRLAKKLKKLKINASFYFLTFPERYYEEDIWQSDIPKKISDMGFEVGLHTDHFYEELTHKKDSITGIKKDIRKLSKLINGKVHGMVYHGHKYINNLGFTNNKPYLNIKPKNLGLDYHDGFLSEYSSKDYSKTLIWRPNLKSHLSDFMGFRGVWNYISYFPIKKLKKLEKGDSMHIVLHPINVFEDINRIKKQNYMRYLLTILKARYCCVIKPIIKTILHKLRIK